MSPSRPASLSAVGLLMALVALAVQIAAASVVPSMGTRTASLDSLVAASICHSDTGRTDPGDAPGRHHAPDCALCPLCQAIVHAGVLIGPVAFVFAAPAAVILRLAAVPQARAPPSRRAAATSARGPPASI